MLRTLLRTLLLAMLLTTALQLSNNAIAELRPIDDDALGDISGQSGLTMELDLNAQIDRISYTDTDGDAFGAGGSLNWEGLSVVSDGPITINLDTLRDFDHDSDPTTPVADLLVMGLAQSSNIDIGLSNLKFGNDEGNFLVALIDDLNLEGSLFGITGVGAKGDTGISLGARLTGGIGQISWADTMSGGGELILDDITFSGPDGTGAFEVIDATLDITPEGLEIGLPKLVGTIDLGGIGLKDAGVFHAASGWELKGTLVRSGTLTITPH